MNDGSTGSTLAFVDSNIWLYTLIQEQNSRKARLAKALLGQGRFAISTQVINEVCVNLIRKGSAPENEIVELIKSFYRKHLVVEPTQKILTNASDLRIRYSFSFWDSLIVSSALHAAASVLYSEDMQHGLVVDRRLQIVNPFL